MPKDPVPRLAGALYRRLEVTPDASPQEIVSAYRRLVRRAHPDVQPGDPGATHRFCEITAAYDVLSDPLRRASYDRSRAGWDVNVPVEAEEGSSDEARDPSRSGPFVLGIDFPPIQPSAAPLWAGPVRVEPGPWSMPTGVWGSLDDPFEVTWPLSEVFEPWWRF
jgi:curved DNA-binding protein CbpA